MTLIEQYLHILEIRLPKDKRADIVNELRELIFSKVEAREAELGRKLTDDEVEAVLREVGHPLVVASRYSEGPQHVVGPTTYPYWLFAVKTAITIQVVISALVFLVRALTGDVARAFGQAIASGVSGAIILIGVATVAAWILERGIVRIGYFDRWRVRDLGWLGFAAWDGGLWGEWFGTSEDWGWVKTNAAPAASPSSTAASPGPGPGTGPSPMDPYYWGKRGRREFRRQRRELRRRNRYTWRRQSAISHGLGSVVFAIVLLLWWVGVFRFGIASGPDDFRSIGIEPGALASFNWASLKTALYVPVIAYIGLVVVAGVTLVTHPAGMRMQGLFDIVIAVLVFGTVTWIWSYSPLSSAVRVDTVAAFFRKVREGFENGPPFALAPILTLALVIASFGAFNRGIVGLWRLLFPMPWGGHAPCPLPA